MHTAWMQGIASVDFASTAPTSEKIDSLMVRIKHVYTYV